MELTALYRCVAALDVDQAKLTVCVLGEEADGQLKVKLREFGGCKRERREMARRGGVLCAGIGGDGEHGDLRKRAPTRHLSGWGCVRWWSTPGMSNRCRGARPIGRMRSG